MTTDPTPGIDLWTAPIAAGGATATPEQMREAWRMWRADRMGARDALAKCLFWTSARYLWGVAGVMLLRTKAAGVIRYVKGRWEIVESSDAG